MTRATTSGPTANGTGRDGDHARRSPEPARHAPTGAALGTSSSRDDFRDLSARLRELERELQQVWASLVDCDAGMAGRAAHAGRSVHRAAAVLETDTIY